jgi:heat shock protein HspQ
VTDYPLAAPEVAAARQKFKAGDRVRHVIRGWVGTVTDEPSDSATAWTVFDGIGMVGADPRNLAHQ